MIDFIKWCNSKKLPLPTGEPTTAENQMRSGIRGQYPDGYVRSQYPDGYFSPVSATAFLDLKNAKNVNLVLLYRIHHRNC